MSNLEDLGNLRTIQNASHHFGCSVQTIYNWVKVGKLDLVLVDGVKFIRLPKFVSK